MRNSLDYAGLAQLCARSPIMRKIMRAHNRIIQPSLVLPFWYRLRQVVRDKGSLNGCVCKCVFVREASLAFKLSVDLVNVEVGA